MPGDRLDIKELIARLDKLSRNEEVQAKLKAPDCRRDLVVCDEAHKMSATFFGGEIKYTQRHKLGQLLSTLTRHFLLMGGSVKQRETRRHAVTHVPAPVRKRDRLIGTGEPGLPRYERIVFEKPLVAVQGKPLAAFVCPGHPLLDRSARSSSKSPFRWMPSTRRRRGKNPSATATPAPCTCGGQGGPWRQRGR